MASNFGRKRVETVNRTECNDYVWPILPLHSMQSRFRCLCQFETSFHPNHWNHTWIERTWEQIVFKWQATCVLNPVNTEFNAHTKNGNLLAFGVGNCFAHIYCYYISPSPPPSHPEFFATALWRVSVHKFILISSIIIIDLLPSMFARVSSREKKIIKTNSQCIKLAAQKSYTKYFGNRAKYNNFICPISGSALCISWHGQLFGSTAIIYVYH